MGYHLHEACNRGFSSKATLGIEAVRFRLEIQSCRKTCCHSNAKKVSKRLKKSIKIKLLRYKI